jgi:hypothetical protein
MTTFPKDSGPRSILTYRNRNNAAGFDQYIILGAIGGTSLSTNTPAASNYRAHPFVFPSGGTLTDVAVYVSTAVAGASGIFGIYNNFADDVMYPSGLIWDSLPFGTVGTLTNRSTSDLGIQAGKLYWLVVNFNGSSTYRAISSNALYPFFGVDSGFGTAFGHTIITSGAFPTSMPNPFPAGGTINTGTPIPAIGVKMT